VKGFIAWVVSLARFWDDFRSMTTELFFSIRPELLSDSLEQLGSPKQSSTVHHKHLREDGGLRR
jgi:hypothetical protein